MHIKMFEGISLGQCFNIFGAQFENIYIFNTFKGVIYIDSSYINKPWMPVTLNLFYFQ